MTTYHVCLFSGVDLYFSPLKETYKIHVEPNSGIHTVSIDSDFRYENRSAPVASTERRSKRAITKNIQDINVDMTSVESNASDADTEHPTYRLHTREAEGFITFIRVTDPEAMLIVRNIQNRLVITLPSRFVKNVNFLWVP